MSFLARLVFVLALLVSCFTAARSSSSSSKRGLGVDWTQRTAFEQLHAAWYYDWGTHADPVIKTSNLPFTPMFWSTSCLYNPDTTRCGGPIDSSATAVLGFNEPDNQHQSNMNVTAALAAWPLLLKGASSCSSGSALIGSPALAGNPVTDTWMPAFMATAGDTVNFTTLHWYKGANAELFISDVKALVAAYGKPVWVTEFAAQDHATAEKHPFRYSWHEVGEFVKKVLTFMEGHAMVHRYAWHNAGVGSSALFFENGTATPTGIVYGSV